MGVGGFQPYQSPASKPYFTWRDTLYPPLGFYALECPILIEVTKIVVQFLFHINNECPESWEPKGSQKKLEYGFGHWGQKSKIQK